MTQEKYEEAVHLQQQIKEATSLVSQLSGELDHVSVCSVKRGYESPIPEEDLENIRVMLLGYFQSRKEKLDKEFKQL